MGSLILTCNLPLQHNWLTMYHFWKQNFFQEVAFVFSENKLILKRDDFLFNFIVDDHTN